MFCFPICFLVHSPHLTYWVYSKSQRAASASQQLCSKSQPTSGCCQQTANIFFSAPYVSKQDGSNHEVSKGFVNVNGFEFNLLFDEFTLNKLRSDFLFITDNGPCRFGVCSQICSVKKAENFSCNCVEGFALKQNGSCQVEGGTPYLFVASESELRRLNPYKVTDLEDILQDNSQTNRINFIDVYFENSNPIIFWTNFHLKGVYYYAVSKNKDTSQLNHHVKRDAASSVKEIITGLKEPRGIAVNWIGKHIYWVDAGTDTISIATLDGKLKRTLITTDLDQPHDIVVDPNIGYIYWSDWGSAKIERAKLDGSERSVLVNEDVQWPTGLAIDFAAKRLYWTDPKAHTVETVNMDGKQRHIVRSFVSDEERPFNIDVFEDFLYITTFPSNAIIKLHKFGHGNITYLVKGLNKASDIIIIHENKQIRNYINPCKENFCGNGALCIANTSENAVCLCPDGMVETRTSDNKTACTVVAPTPSTGVANCLITCLNGGTCILGQDEKSFCRCTPEYEGTTCQIFRCSNYCKNNGFCYTDLLQNTSPGKKPPLKCNCPAEWTGERCETPFQNCNQEDCMNGGTCKYVYGSHYCVCPPGFTGPRCDQCPPLKCENRGYCIKNEEGQNSCECQPGYSGSYCELSNCDKYCVRGNCTLNVDVPSCNCPLGFTGEKCEINRCLNHCLNGGTCQPKNDDKLLCQCPPGFRGRRCEQKLCNCQNEGKCTPLKTESGTIYRCHCTRDFTGTYCETLVATSCHSHFCKNGGTCVLHEGNPICNCKNGWVGQLCEIQVSKWNSCTGYCFNGGRCNLTQGPDSLPRCTCSVMFYIVWLGIINNLYFSRCENRGYCIKNEEGQNSCECQPGYSGSYCELSNCDKYCVRGNCTLNVDVPSCNCPLGFTGEKCEINRCLNHCLNGGTCQPKNDDKLLCQCPPGFRGRRCEQKLCNCQNEGKCTPLKTESGTIYRCHCTRDFTGTYCETLVATSCHSHFCKNGGTCVLHEGNPICNCKNGWVGQLCEIQVSKWNSCTGYCFNGGRCNLTQGPDSLPRCTCNKGWKGKRCQINSLCNNFCFNLATCIPALNEDELPTCVCPKGFVGIRCETNVALAPSAIDYQTDEHPGLIAALVIPIVIVLILIILMTVGIIIHRKRKCSRPFMHVRMQDSANLEISNPMYMREEYDEATEALNSSFSLDPDKATNFANPVYDTLYSGGTGPGEEKKGLLHSDNLHVEYYDGQANETEPGRNHPLA
ncbi:low-density lipoprotein receptor-related protein 1-like [Centruroides sculpturatus]|uniref:low-density lipoprotein receptor-related protein 1-like n=1 Tax=Centruroides sculpturatus TaxID=218467 RepID=UPI000C6D0DAF|nr:low-density lipoprotein receptor-related protein 1-like [Centruroides sculpturatus]